MAKINFYLTGFYLVFIIINVKKTTWLEVENGSGLFNPARPDPKFNGARPSRAGLAHVWGPGLFSRRIVLGLKVGTIGAGPGPALLSRLGPSKMISFPKSF